MTKEILLFRLFTKIHFLSGAVRIIPKASLAWSNSLFLFSALVFFIGCAQEYGRQIEAHGETMGTTYSVKVVVDSQAELSQTALKALADEVFVQVNQSMSTYIPNSELSLWNNSMSTDWLTVSAELFDVLTLSQQISVKSDGAFDVTVMPLVNLWGFGPDKTNKVPTEEQIAQVRPLVDYRKIELTAQPPAARKPLGVHVDLSAVAKGFGADQLARRLLREGYSNFMVEVGGELALHGTNKSNRAWRIGIETPSYDMLQSPQGPAGAVDLSNLGMATSGDYRNYYEVDGKRLSHTIDPVTAKPITHRLASVTVIAKTCAEADAWATALNVMGPDKALEVAEREQLAIFMLVRQDQGFEIKMSSSFKPYLVQ